MRKTKRAAPFGSWNAVVVSFTFWNVLYFTTQRLFPEKSPEFCSRAVTLLHGSIAALYGMNQCFSKVSPLDTYEEPTTFLQGFFLALSLGYFLMDLIWCLYFQSESALMLWHHVYSCIALTRLLFRGTCGNQATCALGVLEVTNPLLQARWFIRSYGMQKSPLFVFVEITFICLFIVVRIVCGTFIVLYVVANWNFSFEFKILAILIYMVSWMFMTNICKYFSFKYIQNDLNVDLNNNIKSS